jgi:hypothetical protein
MITSIGKRIPLKLSMAIHSGFGAVDYPTGPPHSLTRQNQAIAPNTRCRANEKAAGPHVNLEIDMVARDVERIMSATIANVR